MNRGFTLIEMLGCLIILAVLALVAFPAILNLLNSSQGKVDNSFQEFVIGSAKEYVNDHVNCYPRVSSYTYNNSECPNTKPRLDNDKLTVSLLLEEGYISDKSIHDEDMMDDYVEVSVNSDNIYSYRYVIK